MREFLPFAVRDGLIGCVTLTMWLFLRPQDEWHIATGGLTGLCCLLLHEWGHLLGAYRSKAVVSVAPTIFSPFLFNLSSSRNNKHQFLQTSLWGFYATGLFAVVLPLVVSLDLLAGRIALGIAGLLVILTVLIEFPIAWRVYKGYAIPRVEIFPER